MIQRSNVTSKYIFQFRSNNQRVLLKHLLNEYFIAKCTRVFCLQLSTDYFYAHDDVIKWKHFPRYWPFVRGIFFEPCLNKINNLEAGDLRRNRAHCDVTVMIYVKYTFVALGHWCDPRVPQTLGRLLEYYWQESPTRDETIKINVMLCCAITCLYNLI